VNTGQLLQARAGQNESAFSTLDERSQGFGIAMIAVVMGSEDDIEVGGDFRGRYWRRMDLFVGIERKISRHQKVVRLDKPTRIAHPPNGDAFVMGANLSENRIF
jgi:hypothetical protein